MKLFTCSFCNQVVLFENSRCLSCHHELGFLPDQVTLKALEPAGGDLWRPSDASEGTLYRKCGNYSREDVCNWMVESSDPRELCRSCRLNRTIPDLSAKGNRSRWYRIEVAKRRLVFSLMQLGLPVVPQDLDSKVGLAFDFLLPGAEKVLSGYADGLITLNAAEADDPERERVRVDMHEPYRTLLGHCRHESGHHYWAVYVDDSEWTERFRELFGDEREDYDKALKRHYENGPNRDWLERGYISSYASVHPWENWAETWAHYLHMVDTLETAQSFGVAVSRTPTDGQPLPLQPQSFHQMVVDWQRLSFAINSINRSMGISDLYPFVLSPQVSEKLEFIHNLIRSVGKLRSPESALR